MRRVEKYWDNIRYKDRFQSTVRHRLTVESLCKSIWPKPSDRWIIQSLVSIFNGWNIAVQYKLYNTVHSIVLGLCNYESWQMFKKDDIKFCHLTRATIMIKTNILWFFHVLLIQTSPSPSSHQVMKFGDVNNCLVWHEKLTWKCFLWNTSRQCWNV